MPTLLHNKVAMNIVDGIREQLRSIASGVGKAAAFAQKIDHSPGVIIFDDPDFDRHDPDASFRHYEAKYPGVIIEISYTQKRKDLLRLADDYILGSDARVRVVVGVDLDYRGKMATLSIWRPRIEINDAGEEELIAHQTVSDQVFPVDH